ncbi:hypothetical protein C8J56DRAFT_1033840 [Mycena floridula]|nr:hypothetical protein C8J56DRAFT_1033840 [Mycena floridula]
MLIYSLIYPLQKPPKGSSGGKATATMKSDSKTVRLQSIILVKSAVLTKKGTPVLEFPRAPTKAQITQLVNHGCAIDRDVLSFLHNATHDEMHAFFAKNLPVPFKYASEQLAKAKGKQTSPFWVLLSKSRGILEVVEVNRPDGFHVAAHRGCDKVGIADAKVFIAFRDGIDDTTFRSWNTMKLEDSGSESIQVVEAAANDDDDDDDDDEWESDNASDGPPSNARVTRSSTAKAKASNLFKSRKRTLDSNDSDNDSEANEPDPKTRKVSETRKVSASSSRSASSRKLRFSQSDEESETSETRETSSGLQPITPSPRFIVTSRYSSWKTKEDIAKSKIGPWDHGYVMPLPYFSSF